MVCARTQGVANGDAVMRFGDMRSRGDINNMEQLWAWVILLARPRKTWL
jgi:hypothetical protein